MNTIGNKTRKSSPPSRNKTRKSNVPSRNNAIKSMYNKDYYGTELLPMTDILTYVNNNFVIPSMTTFLAFASGVIYTTEYATAYNRLKLRLA